MIHWIFALFPIHVVTQGILWTKGCAEQSGVSLPLESRESQEILASDFFGRSYYH